MCHVFVVESHLVREESLHSADRRERSTASLSKLLLRLLHHSGVVNRFQRWNAWLHLPHTNREHVVLEIVSDRLVDDLWLHARSLQNFWITNARELQHLWRLNRTSSHEDLLLCLDGVRLAVTHESHTSSGVPIQLDSLDHGIGQDVQVRSVSVCGEVASCRVRAQALVRSTPCHQSQGVVETNVITTPWVGWLLSHASGIIASLDKVVLNGQAPVIETRSGGTRSTVVFSNKRHCAAIRHGL